MKAKIIALAIAAALSPSSHAADATESAHTGHDSAAFEHACKAASADAVIEGKNLVGKKCTLVNLVDQPEVVNQDLRQAFVRLPGVLLSEQQSAGQFNVNYRGLGDPQQSEYVGFFENGVPLASDWLGYATADYLPAIDRVDRIVLVRGGSTLLYGPQPGAAIDFITRGAPESEQSTAFRSRHTGGKDGLYATYSEISGANESFGWLVSYDHRQYDGERDNADVDVDGLNASLFWRQSEDASWRLDLGSYDSANGDPGRLPDNVYASQPDLATTRNNRLWIERDSGVLSHQRQFGANTVFDAKLWHVEAERSSVREPRILPGSLPINVARAYDLQEFQSTGLDARVAHAWGDDSTLTFGFTHYVDDSPRSQQVVPQGSGVPGSSYAQQRDSTYTAVFVENAFRFDRLTLIPSARFDWLDYDIDEVELAPVLTRDPIDRSFDQNVPLFGLGLTYDWPEQSLQAYGNISQGYRPMRFDDVASPSADLAPNNDPDVADTTNIEVGLRGAPVPGFFFDVSVFRTDYDDQIEQRQIVDSNQVLRVNTGDARYQGAELSAEYDFLVGRGGDAHLSLFGSASLLDAEIIRSEFSTLVGNTPAYAPDHLVKLGLIYRNGDWLKLALTGTMVDDFYWQDANAAAGTSNYPVAAIVPAYEVFDLSAEWSINRHVKLIGGVNNLFDENYYSRVRSDGVEPAAGRTPYLGVELGF